MWRAALRPRHSLARCKHGRSLGMTHAQRASPSPAPKKGASSPPNQAHQRPSSLIWRTACRTLKARARSTTPGAGLHFETGSFAAPHPEKFRLGSPGEDAAFMYQVDKGLTVLAVADGTSAAQVRPRPARVRATALAAACHARARACVRAGWGRLSPQAGPTAPEPATAERKCQLGADNSHRAASIRATSWSKPSFMPRQSPVVSPTRARPRTIAQHEARGPSSSPPFPLSAFRVPPPAALPPCRQRPPSPRVHAAALHACGCCCPRCPDAGSIAHNAPHSATLSVRTPCRQTHLPRSHFRGGCWRRVGR